MGQYHTYLSKSDKLIAAGRQVLICIEDQKVDMSLVKDDLEAAAEQDDTTTTLGFQAKVDEAVRACLNAPVENPGAGRA